MTDFFAPFVVTAIFGLLAAGIIYLKIVRAPKLTGDAFRNLVRQGKFDGKDTEIASYWVYNAAQALGIPNTVVDDLINEESFKTARILTLDDLAAGTAKMTAEQVKALERLILEAKEASEKKIAGIKNETAKLTGDVDEIQEILRIIG